MDEHALRLLALQRMASIGADIEAQVTISGGDRPVVVMLALAKREAADALVDMVTSDDIETIVKKQAVVRRYGDLIRWAKKIRADAAHADHDLTDRDRDDLIEALSQEPGGADELYALGLIDDGELER